MKNGMSNKGAVITITIMWLVTIPGVLLFFTQVIGWPWDFTLLVLLPAFLFFIPGGYLLAIAGGERYRRGSSSIVPPHFFVKSFLLGVLFCILTMSCVWVYGQLKTGGYIGAAITSLIGIVSLWAVIRGFRGLLSDIRSDDKKPSATREHAV